MRGACTVRASYSVDGGDSGDNGPTTLDDNQDSGDSLNFTLN